MTNARSASFVAILIAATFLMGSSFVAGKILIDAGYPPMMLVGWRFIVAALATLPLAAWREGGLRQALLPAGLQWRDVAIAFAIGLFQTAGVMTLLFYAMRSISASSAAILLFTNPIWVALAGRMFLGDPLQAARVAGLAIGIVGVALALGGKFSGIGFGEIIGLGSALCWTVSTIINKRTSTRFGVWALTFWQMLTGAVIVLALAYASGQHWPAHTTPANWWWFFYLAVPASTGSFGLWFVALARGGATRTSSYLFLAPLFAVICSYFVLHAGLTGMQLVGGALIALAIWLVNREPAAKHDGATA